MRGRHVSPIARYFVAAATTLVIGAGAAHAQGGQGSVDELKGDFEFGMTPEEVMGALAEEIREKYQEKIDATQSVHRHDRLRQKRSREIARLRDTYIEFEGERTGWDVSIIEDQFAHNTGESMLVRWESDPATGEDRRRFFFFHDGELYKMFLALNPSGEDRSFSYFRRLMERRLGSGDISYETDSFGNRRPVAIDWQASGYDVQALNMLEFYGSFCLVVADENRNQRVAQARQSLPEQRQEASGLEDVIADDDDDGPSLDERGHVVDTIIRQR